MVRTRMALAIPSSLFAVSRLVNIYLKLRLFVSTLPKICLIFSRVSWSESSATTKSTELKKDG